jgi:hypothetical protein
MVELKASYTGSATTIKERKQSNYKRSFGVRDLFQGTNSSASGQPGSQPSVRIRFLVLLVDLTHLFTLLMVPYTGDINNINSADVGITIKMLLPLFMGQKQQMVLLL